MSKQTAVAWLRHQLIENMVCRDPAKGISIMYFHDNAFLDLCGQAKQKEKEQIIKAFEAGAKLKEACTPEAYYRLVYGGDDD